MKSLLKALFNAKKQIGVISKETTNPFFKSKYFDVNQLIEHVEPVLEANGLMLMQPLTDGKVFSQIYHVEAGTMIESSMELPQLSDPQKMGSAITYYRRYTLQSLLALQAEDDDANKSSGKIKPPKAEPKKEPVEKQEKPLLTPAHAKWPDAIKAINEGKTTLAEVKEKCAISSDHLQLLENEINKGV